MWRGSRSGDSDFKVMGLKSQIVCVLISFVTVGKLTFQDCISPFVETISEGGWEDLMS